MSYFEKSRFVKELSPANFNQLTSWKLNSKKCSAVLFYADWCPHCKNFKDQWETLARKLAFIDFLAFNCAKYEDHCNKIKEELPQLIKGYPTIIFYSQGSPQEQFRGERKEEDLTKACMRFCQDGGRD